MKHSIPRRDFLRRSAGFAAASLVFPGLRAWGDTQKFAVTDGGKNGIGEPGQVRSKYYGAFTELPVGTVLPRGWIQGWLQRQANGLTGHPENLAYPYATCMYAGKIPPPTFKHGEAWWPYEQSGYFLDGAVRLSHFLQEPAAKKIPAPSLRHILSHSGPGKLGESVWGWPNAVVGRALMAEYDATANPRVAQALSACLQSRPDSGWRDSCVFEEALYLYRLTGDPALLAYARRIYDLYFFKNPQAFSHVDKICGNQPLRTHGVDAAEQLKLLPLIFSHTGDSQALELARLAYRKVEADSLMPDGGVVSAESLGKTTFDSLHETCDITDWSWSLGYVLMADGAVHWADWIERATFNALPGAVTKDFKQLQYFSSANQVLASNTASPAIAETRLSYRAAHDTECCSGNVNRAMPNYVTRMWMCFDGGLAATLYGPCVVNTRVNGQRITITEETNYPFGDTIQFQIQLPHSVKFALGLRIPGWCANASVRLNGAAVPVDCAPGTFVRLQREFHDGDVVTLQLPMTVRFREWFNGGAVSVERGPLVYSLQPEERRVEHWQDPPAIQRVLQGNNIQGFPALEFFPDSDWRYGVEFSPEGKPPAFTVVESPMPENPFLAATVPVRIDLTLTALPQWAANWQSASATQGADRFSPLKNPVALPNATERQARGERKVMKLVPYGATHLRLTTLPKLMT